MPGPYREGQDLYFHAGQDFVLNTRDVIGVFDLDTAGASRRTEEYFRHVESEGAVGSSAPRARGPRALSPISPTRPFISVSYRPPR